MTPGGTPETIQVPVVLGAVGALGVGGAWLAVGYGARQAGVLLIGGALGLVLHHAAFGLTRTYRLFVTVGDGRGIRAQLLMLAVATVLFAPVLAAGEAFGTPVGGAVAPASVAVAVGAFVFAIGMQLGGGCGSGTLYQTGTGSPAVLVTLLFFVAGSVLATFHMEFWATMPSLGEVTLGERLGWGTAVAVQLAICGLLAVATLRGNAPRRRAVREPLLPRGWARLVRGPWPLAAAAIALAALNALTLVVAGHPWAITWAFTLWGGKALALAGYDLSGVPFWTGEFQRHALAAPLLADTTSVMNLGLVLGALLGAGLAGTFGRAGGLSLSRLAAAVLGGLLLGYGARIAFGCNIGALFSGIASTSLHGWLWAAAALAGTPVGVRFRSLFRLDA
jgi:hypothetical protein